MRLRLPRGRPGWLASPATLGLLAVAFYAPTITFDLVDYDDTWLVSQNTLLREPSRDGLSRIWFDLTPELRLRLGAEYLPIRDLSIMLDHLLHGGSPAGLHLTNLLLYGLLASVLGLAIERWTGQRELAWIAGLLYVFHPLHVESVAWVSERKGLLAALGVSLAALAFERFVRRPRLVSWLVTSACLVAAVWSKAVAVSGPAILAVLLALLVKRRRGPGIGSGRDKTTRAGEGVEEPCSQGAPTLEHSEYFDETQRGERGRVGARRDRLVSSRAFVWLGLLGIAVLTLAAFWPVWHVGRELGVAAESGRPEVVSRLWLAAQVHGHYLRQLLLLGPHAVAQELPTGALATLLGIFGAAAAAGVLSLALVTLWLRPAGRKAVAGVAASVWCVTLVPVCQLFIPLQNTVADRYMLLPSGAFCLAAALVLGAIPHRPLRYGLLLLALLAAAVASAKQMRSWASSEALYRHAIEVHPGNLRLLLHLSALARERGDLAGAAGWLARARALAPEDSRVLLHEGLQLVRAGRRDDARAAFRRAAVRDPQADKAAANLALLLAEAGSHDEALEWARRAVRVRPLAVHNQRSRGVVALGSGRFDEAIRAFRRAVELGPDDPRNLYNLGLGLVKHGRLDEARVWLERALARQPGFRPALELLERVKAAERSGPLALDVLPSHYSSAPPSAFWYRRTESGGVST